MYTAQAKMRLSCSARSSSSCLVRSFQKIFQQQRSVFVPFSQQHQSSLFIAAATRPGHQQQLAGSRTWRFSSTPRLIARSGDGEGATDSMEGTCTTPPTALNGQICTWLELMPHLPISVFAGMSVELEVKIEGMKCGGCSSRVEEALKVCMHPNRQGLCAATALLLPAAQHACGCHAPGTRSSCKACSALPIAHCFCFRMTAANHTLRVLAS